MAKTRDVCSSFHEYIKGSVCAWTHLKKNIYEISFETQNNVAIYWLQNNVNYCCALRTLSRCSSAVMLPLARASLISGKACSSAAIHTLKVVAVFYQYIAFITIDYN